MSAREQRSILRPVEVRAGDEGRTLSGLAAVYYDGTERTEYRLWRGVLERVMPGAFDRAIEEADDVRALFNHDASAVLGRSQSGTLRLSTTDEGLAYEVDLGDTSIARDVAEHIARGDISGSSFAFSIERETWLDDEARSVEIRQIEQVRLYDVGPVTFPAYDATAVGVRSDEHLAEARRMHGAYVAHRSEARAAMRERYRRRVRLIELDY